MSNSVLASHMPAAVLGSGHHSPSPSLTPVHGLPPHARSLARSTELPEASNHRIFIMMLYVYCRTLRVLGYVLAEGEAYQQPLSSLQASSRLAKTPSSTPALPDDMPGNASHVMPCGPAAHRACHTAWSSWPGWPALNGGANASKDSGGTASGEAALDFAMCTDASRILASNAAAAHSMSCPRYVCFSGLPSLPSTPRACACGVALAWAALRALWGLSDRGVAPGVAGLDGLAWPAAWSCGGWMS